MFVPTDVVSLRSDSDPPGRPLFIPPPDFPLSILFCCHPGGLHMSAVNTVKHTSIKGVIATSLM